MSKSGYAFFLRHFVDIIRVGYGYGSYWGAVFNLFFAIWSQYAFIRQHKKYAFGY